MAPVSGQGGAAPARAWRRRGPQEPGVYLLLAPRAADGEAFIGGLADGELERLVFFGDDVRAVDLLAILGTPSLMGARRLILVRHAEAIPRPEWRALAEGLARQAVREDWLVLWDRSEDGALASALPLDALQRLRVVDLRAPQTEPGPDLEAPLPAMPPATAAWVRAVLRRHPDRAAGEAAKLALYEGERLDEGTVRRLLAADLVEEADLEPSGAAAEGERRRFEVAEAALEGDLSRALALAGALERAGVPPAWVWREIGRQAVEAWETAETLERRYGPPPAWPPDPWRELASSYPGRPPFALRRLARVARRWGTEGLFSVLRWAAEADYDAKRGGMEPREALLRLLARMAHRLDRGA